MNVGIHREDLIMVQSIFRCFDSSKIRKSVLENAIKKMTIATTVASVFTFVYLGSNGLTQAFTSESENSNPHPVETSYNSGVNLSIDSPSVNNLGEPLNATPK